MTFIWQREHPTMPTRVTCPRCGWKRFDPREPGFNADSDGRCKDREGCRRRNWTIQKRSLRRELGSA